MTWEPGHSGNPNGYKGPRDRARREVFEKIKGLGHLDAIEILSTIANDQNAELGYRVAASSALVPYCHPKLQSLPTLRWVETPIEVPEFIHLSDAESFLAKIAAMVARGELDIQTGLELSTLAKNWIDAQYAKEELQFKINPPEQRDTVIRVEGGLPALPGTNITMPMLDHGPVTNGHALAPPAPQIEANESVPTNGQGSATQGGDPVA